MTKKKTKAITTEVTVINEVRPQINTTLDLKLTRQDLIETIMYDIEDKIDEKIEKLSSELKKMIPNDETMKANFDKDLIALAKKNLGKTLLNRVKDMGAEITVNNYDSHEISDDKNNRIFTTKRSCCSYDHKIEIPHWFRRGISRSVNIETKSSDERLTISYSPPRDQFRQTKTYKEAVKIIKETNNKINELGKAYGEKYKIDNVTKKVKVSLVRAIIKDQVGSSRTMTVESIVEDITAIAGKKLLSLTQ